MSAEDWLLLSDVYANDLFDARKDSDDWGDCLDCHSSGCTTCHQIGYVPDKVWDQLFMGGLANEL